MQLFQLDLSLYEPSLRTYRKNFFIHGSRFVNKGLTEVLIKDLIEKKDQFFIGLIGQEFELCFILVNFIEKDIITKQIFVSELFHGPVRRLILLCKTLIRLIAVTG